MDQFWTEPAATPGTTRLGLTEAWLESLGGEVVGLELLAPGTRLEAGDGFGFLHVATGTLDLRSPGPLRIVGVNRDALRDARLVRASPTLRGWLIEFE